MTQRIEPFFEYDSKNWKNFMIFWLKELNLFWIWLENLNFFLNVTHRIELFYWSKEMSSFFQNDKDFVEYDSKNRTFVWICLQELNLFWNFTQWIEHSAQKDSKNWTLKDYLNNKTFLWIGESIWLKELNFFSRISLKNYWPFLTWLTELNSVLENDSPNWTFFFFLRIWLIEIEPFFSTWVKENDSIF